jgi:hypothetical protein
MHLAVNPRQIQYNKLIPDIATLPWRNNPWQAAAPQMLSTTQERNSETVETGQGQNIPRHVAPPQILSTTEDRNSEKLENVQDHLVDPAPPFVEASTPVKKVRPKGKRKMKSVEWVNTSDDEVEASAGRFDDQGSVQQRTVRYSQAYADVMMKMLNARWAEQSKINNATSEHPPKLPMNVRTGQVSICLFLFILTLMCSLQDMCEPCISVANSTCVSLGDIDCDRCRRFKLACVRTRKYNLFSFVPLSFPRLNII